MDSRCCRAKGTLLACAIESGALNAASGCPRRQAHAVVLQLPPALCAERAAARVGHEGGVGGPGAKRIVYNMAAQIRNAGLPSAPAEGVASVMVRAGACPAPTACLSRMLRAQKR